MSLVSDASTDIYIMSKHDILRQLPKKMLSALFCQDMISETVPSDEQLLQMHRLNERWNAFRRRMHSEALASRSQAPALALREPASSSRSNAADSSVLPSPSGRGPSLSFREQAHFSHASARFLRQVKDIKNDRGLRAAFKRDGLLRQHQLGDVPVDEEGGGDDPMSFWLEDYWSKLGSDPVGLDIDAELSEEDETPVPSLVLPRVARRGSVEGRGVLSTSSNTAELRLPPL